MQRNEEELIRRAHRKKDFVHFVSFAKKDCPRRQAAAPSRASRKQETLYNSEHVRGCKGM